MMNQTPRYQHAMRGLRKYALLLSAFSLGTTTTGCRSEPAQQQEEESAASVTFSIKSEDFYQAPDSSQQGRGLSSLSSRSSLAYSFTDVSRIRVDIKEKATGNVLFVNFDLLWAETEWKGVIPSLPKNKELTFTARAFNASGTLLFNGTTDQTLTSNNQTVIIALAAANDGQTIALPRIKRISIPSAFSSDQSGNISFAVEATTGEALKYTLEPATGGGTFFPTTGTLTLAATAGTFVSQYAPPVVDVEKEFEHKVTVTNAAGHSITTTFKTKVKPPGKVDSVRDGVVNVLFNPVINALNAGRVVGTGNVIFTATVADDTPTSLTYAWGFTPDGSFDPVPAFTGGTNPSTLQNYTTAVQGTVLLSVTDADGGKTTLKYPLTPNQFPDNPYVEGPSSGLNSIRAGASHTCALFNNGTMRCWGFNGSGQLGYGNTFSIGDASTRLPYTAGNVPYVGVGTKMAVGGNHTCALFDSGYVTCWGRNNYGQLGYNTTQDVGDSEAISTYGYVNLGGIAIKIAAGQNHTCALMDTGKVRCWGLNSSGQLGYGHKNNIGDDEQPWTVGDVQVDADPNRKVKDIIAGAYHTCAILETGAVRCRGNNTWGQLGYSNTTRIGDDEHPSTVGNVNLSGGNVLQLAAGYWHTCALLDTGYVRCWGLNSSGQLGYGHTNDTYAPPADVSTGSKVLQVAAGSDHTCALLSTGGIKCWGYGEFGQLGYGTASSQVAPPSGSVDLDGATAFQVSTGAYHTCALLSTGKARCWGLNGNGQLGYGHTRNIGDDELPSSAGDIQLLAP